MEPDLSTLDAFLDGHGFDGYLLDDDATNADQRYLSGFGGHDPFVTLYADGAVHLLVRGLDRGLARRRSNAETVSTPADFDYREKVESYGTAGASHRVVAEFLAVRGVDAVVVPERFPIGVADSLRALDVAIVPESDVDPTAHGVLAGIRSVKMDEEVDHIRTVQHATERAMRRAEDLLREAIVDDGTLLHRTEVGSTEPLTSERMRRAIERTLLDAGCSADGTIVACGRDAADPHERGRGPLRANEPIVIDIFPRSRETKYHADMTRTFVVGEADRRAREWYDLTRRAYEAALDAIEPGVTGEAVHDAACDVIEAAGLPTLRTDESAETGFVHGTGHGVGLDVHELPRVSADGGELEPGHVITVEPGLYDPDVGGFRIEDLVVVTTDGYENLTSYHTAFVV